MLNNVYTTENFRSRVIYAVSYTHRDVYKRQALQERSDLNYKISDLELRLTQNSLVQEGEVPNENPEELLKTLEQCVNLSLIHI